MAEVRNAEKLDLQPAQSLTPIHEYSSHGKPVLRGDSHPVVASEDVHENTNDLKSPFSQLPVEIRALIFDAVVQRFRGLFRDDDSIDMSFDGDFILRHQQKIPNSRYDFPPTPVEELLRRLGMYPREATADDFPPYGAFLYIRFKHYRDLFSLSQVNRPFRREIAQALWNNVCLNIDISCSHESLLPGPFPPLGFRSPLRRQFLQLFVEYSKNWPVAMNAVRKIIVMNTDRTDGESNLDEMTYLCYEIGKLHNLRDFEFEFTLVTNLTTVKECLQSDTVEEVEWIKAIRGTNAKKITCHLAAEDRPDSILTNIPQSERDRRNKELAKILEQKLATMLQAPQPNQMSEKDIYLTNRAR